MPWQLKDCTVLPYYLKEKRVPNGKVQIKPGGTDLYRAGASIDRIFDIGRTALNITGDASFAIIVSNKERKKELKKTAK